MSVWAERRWREIQALLHTPSYDPPAVTHVLPTWALNQTEGVTLLRSLEPDLLLVTSGPLLSAEVLAVPRIGTLNLHYGLAPWYRGEHTLIVPLRNRDESRIGITLHEIDSGIDTGRIVARSTLPIDEDESEVSLWVKAAKEFAEMLPEALSTIERTRAIPGVTQEPAQESVLIRYRDRRWWWDIADRLSPPRPSRREGVREWYFREGAG